MNAGSLVIGHITSYDRQIVLKGGCCDNEIRLREGVPELAAFFDKKAPSQHDVFGDFQHARFKHRANFVDEPVVQLGTASGIRKAFDPKADFGERDGTDEKNVHGL